MPIRRDAGGKFASGGGPSRSAKIAKVKGHKKAVQANKNAQHNLAQVRKKAEKADDLAWRKGDKAAMAKTEKHLAKVGASGTKLVNQQKKLGNLSSTGGKRVHEFTAADIRKRKLASVAKKKGK